MRQVGRRVIDRKGIISIENMPTPGRESGFNFNALFTHQFRDRIGDIGKDTR